MFNKLINNLNSRSKFDSNKNKAAGELVKAIRQIDMKNMPSVCLTNVSHQLIGKAMNGAASEDLLIEAYAIVNETIDRVLKIKPFDCQLLAAIHLNKNNIIEMQTGEGKTLTAVFPAYLNALTGKGVHIMTFNDYLATRDAEWMGPVFKFLGLSVGYICEGMTAQERRTAYDCNITYVTIKEAGFDYLRDSLSYDSNMNVQRPFNFAIIDEADSIMIDEAKIPLVIAAGVSGEDHGLNRINKLIKEFRKGTDYNIDEYLRNVYLTDTGVHLVESEFKCGNLYNKQNMQLVSDINSVLHAEVLLRRDVDYIVKDGKIVLVDDFTGRIAENRHWPDRLQTAVEVKEGISTASRGRIMSSITIQNFVNLYPKLSGMTGTAASSEVEFNNFYGLDTVVIPANKPCIRIDYPDFIFKNGHEKYKALLNEIITVNMTGRPILIGTSSVMESEKLALELKNNNIQCQVLNAKNDQLEAQIIANAGAYGSVTVSTNMAGRGTDIKLGGTDERDRDKVVELGGLYVIGTTRHENIRIDNQLRGRAGRQGDPGSSRFFICLDDNIFNKNDVTVNNLKKFYNNYQGPLIENPGLARGILQIQRTLEGQNYEIRKTLWKYSNIIEQQRRIIFKERADVLHETANQTLLQDCCPEKYKLMCTKLGHKKFKVLERNLIIYCIDHCWSDYLEHIAYIRDGIHLVIIGGKNPFEEYLRQVTQGFEDLKKNIREEIINVFSNVKISENEIDLGVNQFKGPSSTWTYMINDNPFEDDLGLMLASSRNVGFSAVAASLPIISINLIISLILKKIKKKNKHID